MKNIIFIVCFFMSLLSVNAQENVSFYVKISNSNYVPSVSHTYSDKKIGETKTDDLKLNDLLKKYKIYSIERVFSSFQDSFFQNIFMIESDSIELMCKMNENFPQFYPIVEDARVTSLAYPNDFGTLGGYTLGDQEELNYINAPLAWDLSTGSSNIVIGIADTNFAVAHEDLVGKISVVNHVANNQPNSFSDHGTTVSSIAAANTNNGVGMSAIGYDSYIYAVKERYIAIDSLSQYDEVKVINASWRQSQWTSITEAIMDSVINTRKKVVVAAAGNGNNGPNIANNDPSEFFMPASLKDVISVSSIGHTNQTFSYSNTGMPYWETFTDYHQDKRDGMWVSHQHNDSVDVVAPGYGVTVARNHPTLDYQPNSQGTSYAAPMVTGTIALMFDANYCLGTKEVETILKLTAVKIDTLPQNLPFYGKLGAGKLDAYEAVKMSKDMADPFGTVEVKNRILYRPWFYKLTTAPYEIKLSNNDVSGGSKLKFRARNNIEIISGTYMPDTGYIDFQIDENLDLSCPPPPVLTPPQTNNTSGKSVEEDMYVVFPTLVKDQFTIKSKHVVDQPVDIKVFDFFGVEVLSKAKVLVNEDYVVPFDKFRSGIYVLKIYNNGDVAHTEKLVKK